MTRRRPGGLKGELEGFVLCSLRGQCVGFLAFAVGIMLVDAVPLGVGLYLATFTGLLGALCDRQQSLARNFDDREWATE